MSYETPTRISHPLTLTTSASTPLSIRGPKGMKGRIVDVVGTVTTAITTTLPKIAIGNGAGFPAGSSAVANSYAEFTLAGTLPLAIGTAWAASDSDPSFKSRTANTYKGKINADMPVIVTVPTVSAAGVSSVAVIIEWFV